MNRTGALMRVAILGGAFLGPGCMGKTIRREPPKPAEAPQKSLRETLFNQLIGRWEAPGMAGKMKSVTFDKSGGLTFEGGLQKYNPASWDLDADRQELRLTFHSISNENLQVFQLYVGQGVKRFEPSQKQVVYSFTPTTWTLNIAGWEYSKPDNSLKFESVPEPVFK